MARPRLKPGNGRKRRRQVIRPPIAAMGDIAFLLIIFFIIVSNFVQNRKVNPELPTAADIEKLDITPITVAIDEEEQTYVNGRPIGKSEDLEGIVRAMIQARGEIIDGDQSPEARAMRTVMFRCDKSVPHDTFEPVVEAISGAGGILALEADRLNQSP